MTNLKCYRCLKVKPLESFSDFKCWWCLDCLKKFLPTYLAQMHPRRQLWSLFKAEREEFFPPKSVTKMFAFLNPLLEFIDQHPDCTADDILNAFEGQISRNYCYKALKKLESDKYISSFSLRPKKFKKIPQELPPNAVLVTMTFPASQYNFIPKTS